MKDFTEIYTNALVGQLMSLYDAQEVADPDSDRWQELESQIIAVEDCIEALVNVADRLYGLQLRDEVKE